MRAYIGSLLARGVVWAFEHPEKIRKVIEDAIELRQKMRDARAAAAAK